MANDSFKVKKSLNIEPKASPSLSQEGDFGVNSSDNEAKAFLGAALRTLVTEDQAQTLTNKTIDGNLNTITNIGAGSLSDGSVTTAKLSDAAVTTAKISDLAVTTAKLADAAVTEAKISDLSVSTGKIADGAVTTAKLSDASVTEAKLSDLSISTGKIVDAAVTTVKLSDAAVTEAKLSDLSVSTGKIADGAVTTIKLSDAAVTTAKISDASITDAKLAPLNVIAVTGDVTLTNRAVHWVSSAAPRNLTLPAHAAGQVVTITDSTGSCETNNFTVIRTGGGNIAGVAASRILMSNWGSWTLVDNGTDWNFNG